jgi:glycosyltransferase involved in cell wall biosynthesis
MIEESTSRLNRPIACFRISVAMATYNGEKHIREQLDSIARQDLLPLELVVTDDGSTDATLQIVGDFARDAAFPVRVFRNETRLRFADNFLKAASLCEGDLIAFCDQDDIWMEKKLSICSEFLADERVLLAIHSAQTITQAGSRGFRYPDFPTTKALNVNTCDPFSNRPGFAMVFRKALLNLSDSSQRPSRLYGHDHFVWFLATCTGKIVTIADVLAQYRQHDGNIYGATQPRSFVRRARNFAGPVDYDGGHELACSGFLRTAAEWHPDCADRLRKSAERLAFRSKLHQVRAHIYKRESTLRRRITAFLKIVILSGYLPDRSKTRLGIRAGLKDMVFGVTMAYRCFVPADNASTPNK